MRNIYTIMLCEKKKKTHSKMSSMGYAGPGWEPVVCPVMESHGSQGPMAAWAGRARGRGGPGSGEQLSQ